MSLLLDLWCLPMNVLARILVFLAQCTEDPNVPGDWHVRPGGWLDRWLFWVEFKAFTPSRNCIIYRSDIDSYSDEYLVELYAHEITHTFQHQRYGPFFLLVYGYHALLSWLQGNGWHRGNRLEREARGEV